MLNSKIMTIFRERLRGMSELIKSIGWRICPATKNARIVNITKSGYPVTHT